MGLLPSILALLLYLLPFIFALSDTGSTDTPGRLVALAWGYALTENPRNPSGDPYRFATLISYDENGGNVNVTTVEPVPSVDPVTQYTSAIAMATDREEKKIYLGLTFSGDSRSPGLYSFNYDLTGEKRAGGNELD